MSKNKIYTEEQREVFKFVKILTGLVIVIFLLYLFTNYVVNKGETYKRTNNSGKINYETISLGTLLNKPDSEYYVLAVDKSNTLNNTYLNAASNYKSGVKHLPIYIADLSNEFNKSFIADESNYKVDIADLKVKGTTLIKVKDKKITKFIEEKNDILNELN
ncbi:MAG: hypothetical protein IKX00_00015 [Bacilli bacterium]|nr:hypothetical protein [Bacilli bacterium]